MAVTPPARRGADTAVQLTTLAGWRQFAAAVPSVPDLLPEQDWLALEDGKRAAHDEERLEHHSRLVVVQTPVIGRIVTQGGNLIRMNRLAHYGRSGLMVSGPARTGKTTAITQLGKTVEVTHRRRHPRLPRRHPRHLHHRPAGRDRQDDRHGDRPVSRHPRSPPGQHHRRDRAGLRHLPGHPREHDHRGRTAQPGHDHRGGRRGLRHPEVLLRKAAVHFRLLRDRAGPRGTAGRPRGDQVAGRFTLIPASAFTPGREWSALIAAVEGSLRLYRHKDGYLVKLADDLHRRTRGMIGSLLWLLRDASARPSSTAPRNSPARAWTWSPST